MTLKDAALALIVEIRKYHEHVNLHKLATQLEKQLSKQQLLLLVQDDVIGLEFYGRFNDTEEGRRCVDSIKSKNQYQIIRGEVIEENLTGLEPEESCYDYDYE